MLLNVNCNGFCNELCYVTRFGKCKGNGFVMNICLLVNVICNGYCNELCNLVMGICNGSCNELFYETGFGHF